MKNLIKMFKTFEMFATIGIRFSGKINPKSLNSRNNLKNPSKSGFSLVELLIVVTIIGVLSVVSFVAIQRAKTRAMNEKMLDDLIAISSALEDYQRDHLGAFPIPDSDDNQNVLCYNLDATYAHDCENAEFRQGMIDNKLLTKRYLREVPTDPRTGSRYVYGVNKDGKYFQVAGIYEMEDGSYETRTVENIARGYPLPSLIRAFDSPNFVLDKEGYLPYSPNHLILTATLNNVNGTVTVTDHNDNEPVSSGLMVGQNAEIIVDADSSVDLYFSDGSVTHMDPESELVLKNMTVDKNDKEGTFTKILIKLKVGKIWSKVVRLASESEFRVETTTAIAGVRGTEFGADANGTFKVKDGDVWTQDKGAGMSGDMPAEEIFEIETPPEGDDIYKETPVADSDYYKEYYETIYLHSGIQPHILSVEPEGIVTIRNINHFVDEADADVGVDRSIQATHLVAYDAESMNLDTGKYTVLAEHTPVSASNGNPHVFQSTEYFIGHSVIFRFEDIDSETDEILYHSSFSEPPIHIESGTELIEGDIYEEEGAFELPILSWTVDPSGGYVVENMEFTITLSLLNTDGFEFPSDGVDYTVVLVDDPDNPNDPYCTFVSSTGNEFKYLAGDIPDVNCEFSVTTNLADGTVLSPSDNIFIDIINDTSQLMLKYPSFGAVLAENDVHFDWEALNAPGTVSFNLLVEKSSNGNDGWSNVINKTFDNENTSYAPPDNTLAVSPFYRWSVTMDDGAGNTETAGSWDFQVIGQDAAVASFTIGVTDVSDNPVAPPNTENPFAFSINSSEALNIAFTATTIPDGFTYNWSSNIQGLFTVPESGQTPTANTSTLLEGMNSYNVFLDVKDPNDLVVSSIAQMIEVEYVALSEITAIEFVDEIDSSATSYDAVVGEDFILNTTADGVRVRVTKIDDNSSNIQPGNYVNTHCVFSLSEGAGSVDVENGTYTASEALGDQGVVRCILTENSVIQVDGIDYIVGPNVNATVTISSVDGEPTLAVTTSQTYYAVNTDIPLTIENLTEDISITPSGASITDGKFNATQPGTYTLSATGVPSVILIVCGYTGANNNECWVLGLPGESCTAACLNPNDPEPPNPLSLGCVAGLDQNGDPVDQGTYGDWNDDANCTICNQFGETDKQVCEGNTSDKSPYYILDGTDVGTCTYRSTGIISCAGTVPPSYQRVCKCE